MRQFFQIILGAKKDFNLQLLIQRLLMVKRLRPVSVRKTGKRGYKHFVLNAAQPLPLDQFT